MRYKREPLIHSLGSASAASGVTKGELLDGLRFIPKDHCSSNALGFQVALVTASHVQKTKITFLLCYRKIKASPVSRDANSFDCPKCGNLISPDNLQSYSEFGYEKLKGALIQCKRCKTRIQLTWQTDPSR